MIPRRKGLTERAPAADVTGLGGATPLRGHPAAVFRRHGPAGAVVDQQSRGQGGKAIDVLPTGGDSNAVNCVTCLRFSIAVYYLIRSV